jgi:hypothetical protein
MDIRGAGEGKGGVAIAATDAVGSDDIAIGTDP